MADWPGGFPLGDLHTQVLSTIGLCGPGGPWGTPAVQTQAWPANNDAIFVPVRVPEPCTVYRMACGTGTATTGNFDLGIYDVAGNRLVSTGSTAKTTASSDRIIDVTDTFLLPGMYYLAMGCDTASAAYFGLPLGSGDKAKLLGLRRGTTFALPATQTYATATSSVLPAIAAYLRSEA